MVDDSSKRQAPGQILLQVQQDKIIRAAYQQAFYPASSSVKSTPYVTYSQRAGTGRTATVGDILYGVAQAVWEELAAWYQTLNNAVKNGLAGAVSWVNAANANIQSVINGWSKTTWTGLADFSSAARQWWDDITTGAIGWLKNLNSTARTAIDAAAEWVATATANVQNVISTARTQIRTALGAIYTTLEDWWNTFRNLPGVKLAIKLVGEFWNGLDSLGRTALQTAADLFSGKTSVQAIIGSLAGKTLDISKIIWGGTGILTPFQSDGTYESNPPVSTNAFDYIWSKIFGDIRIRGSGSTRQARPRQIGEWFTQEYQKIIDAIFASGTNIVNSISTSLFGVALTPAVRNAIKLVGDTFSGSTSWTIKAIELLFASGTNIVNNISTALFGTGFTAVARSALKLVGNFFSGAANVGTKIIQAVFGLSYTTLSSGLIAAMKDIFGGAGSLLQSLQNFLGLTPGAPSGANVNLTNLGNAVMINKPLNFDSDSDTVGSDSSNSIGYAMNNDLHIKLSNSSNKAFLQFGTSNDLELTNKSIKWAGHSSADPVSNGEIKRVGSNGLKVKVNDVVKDFANIPDENVTPPPTGFTPLTTDQQNAGAFWIPVLRDGNPTNTTTLQLDTAFGTAAGSIGLVIPNTVTSASAQSIYFVWKTSGAWLGANFTAVFGPQSNTGRRATALTYQQRSTRLKTGISSSPQAGDTDITNPSTGDWGVYEQDGDADDGAFWIYENTSLLSKRRTRDFGSRTASGTAPTELAAKIPSISSAAGASALESVFGADDGYIGYVAAGNRLYIKAGGYWFYRAF